MTKLDDWMERLKALVDGGMSLREAAASLYPLLSNDEDEAIWLLGLLHCVGLHTRARNEGLVTEGPVGASIDYGRDATLEFVERVFQQSVRK